jgi:hypothetical protein
LIILVTRRFGNRETSKFHGKSKTMWAYIWIITGVKHLSCLIHDHFCCCLPSVVAVLLLLGFGHVCIVLVRCVALMLVRFNKSSNMFYICHLLSVCNMAHVVVSLFLSLSLSLRSPSITQGESRVAFMRSAVCLAHVRTGVAENVVAHDIAQTEGPRKYFPT